MKLTDNRPLNARVAISTILVAGEVGVQLWMTCGPTRARHWSFSNLSATEARQLSAELLRAAQQVEELG